jgi:hypothetical protein
VSPFLRPLMHGLREGSLRILSINPSTRSRIPRAMPLGLLSVGGALKFYPEPSRTRCWRDLG